VNTLLDRLALNYAKVHGFRPSSWNMEALGLWAMEVKAGLNLTPFDAIEYRSTWLGEPARERVSGFLRGDEMDALRRIVHEPGTEGR